MQRSGKYWISGLGLMSSGLWHQKQRSEQPLRKTVVRNARAVVDGEALDVGDDALLIGPLCGELAFGDDAVDDKLPEFGRRKAGEMRR